MSFLNHTTPSLEARFAAHKKRGDGFNNRGAELLDDFYKVFSINMRDLGSPGSLQKAV